LLFIVDALLGDDEDDEEKDDDDDDEDESKETSPLSTAAMIKKTRQKSRVVKPG
jgi:hypothetical protein